jgi:hypothetical protein
VGARPAAGLLVLVAPVGLVGLDQVDGEDLAGGELGDGDLVVVSEGEDAFAGVFGADAEVVHAAGAAEGHLAFGIEPVVAQPVVALGVPVSRCGCGAVQRAVRAVLVVMLAELVELALQLGDAGGRWSGLEPALQGLVEAFGLAPCLGCPGDPFLWRTPSSGRTYSKALRPPVNRDV